MTYQPSFIANQGEHLVDGVLADNRVCLAVTGEQVSTAPGQFVQIPQRGDSLRWYCLLYTSDAADE